MRLYHFPPPIWPLPSRSGRSEAAAHIRDTYVDQAWRQAGPLRRASFAAACLLWPIAAAAMAARETWRSGSTLARRLGKGRCLQFLEQYQLALRHGILPRYYYVFELHDPALRAVAADYLHRFETKGGIYSMLRRGEVTAAAGRPLHDKEKFFACCRASGIATPEVLLSLKGGGGEAADLAPIDLFVKPTTGRGGEGAEKWLHIGNGWLRHDCHLDAAALLARLRRQSRDTPLIVQPALRPHPALADVAMAALPTVRIITMVDEAGDVEALNAVFRMPRALDSAVDNFHAGGIAAAVDMASGRLGAATDIGLGDDTAWYRHHPVTGAAIAGRSLPYWREVGDLACRAHRAMNDRAIIGWDVAILADGPAVIEGNGWPDLDIHQRAERRPLGNLRLGRLLSHHLRLRQGKPPRPEIASAPLPSDA